MSSKTTNHFINIISLQFKVAILLSTVFASIPITKGESQYVENWNFTSPIIVNYTWVINKEDEESIIYSPVFSGNEIEQFKWELELRNSSYNSEYELYLELKSGDGPVKVQCKFFINTEHLTHEITMNDSFVEGHWKLVMFPKFDEINSIRLEMSVDQDFGRLSAGCDAILPVNYLPDDYNFEKLLENQLFSDMTVEVKGQTIRAHKAILSMASPVWMKKFQDYNNYYSQYKANEADDLEIFRKVLRFIYTGKIDDIENSAMTVLPLASIYEIVPLTKLCEATICKSINETNVVDVLALAEQHKSEALVKQASLFIVVHAPEIVDTPAFKFMEESRACFKIIRGIMKRLAK